VPYNTVQLFYTFISSGHEAGGHGSASAPPVISLVTSILDTLAVDNRPPIIAAGGFSTGGQVAAMLTLGASGVALGTRFILTPESRYSAAQKAALVAADSTATKRSIAWDKVRDTVDWPNGIDGRGIYNALVKDFESGVEISHLQQKLAQNLKSDDIAYQVVWSGTGVGEMSEVKGAQVSRWNPHVSVVFATSFNLILTLTYSISCTTCASKLLIGCNRAKHSSKTHDQFCDGLFLFHNPITQEGMSVSLR
jgi:nitronate monooxygenase